ncbi:DUF1850 domain-containing protein [Alkalihalobacillus sp. CinArs1]|uniref:DUF1850 domain-containing protein n=1 Tax=Alkalihalobacillus sp. CinArs1 TaxID=2995314 RepID=UPI0022DDB7B8|nr:DUF1850 domain-containing protein [Alkalihalobacillus sp. CinArs1]
MNRTKRGHRQGAPLFLTLFFLLALVLLLAIQKDVLLVEEENEVIDVFLTADTFSVRWDHSVEKEEWEEFFKVEGSELIVTHTRFKTFGAGVPSHAGKKTYIKDGWVYMTGLDQSVDDSLFIRTGDETKHRLTVAGQSEKLKANSSFHITVKKLNLLKALLVKLTC